MIHKMHGEALNISILHLEGVVVYFKYAYESVLAYFGRRKRWAGRKSDQELL